MTLTAIETWIATHPVLATFVILPLVGAVMNWLTWFESEAAWKAYEVRHPQRARAVRILRALFPHLRKAFPALKEILPPSGPPGGDPPQPPVVTS
jgi:hypothetical protein